MTETVSTIEVQRHTWTSTRNFDEVLAAVESGLGHPDFHAESKELEVATDWDQFQGIVARNTGSVGLAVFLQLDLGVALRIDPDAVPRRAVRIIAGNPVTMSSLVRDAPEAGSSVPVTILVFEINEIVHVQYDTVASALPVGTPMETLARAAALDEKVQDLLRLSAGPGQADAR